MLARPETASEAADGRSAAGRSARTGPLATAAIVIYATFALLLLAAPGSLAATLRELSPNPAIRAALVLAEGLEAAGERAGVAAFFRSARERFGRISCGGPDSANPC